MKKFEIILALEQVAAARKKWNEAERKFRSDLWSVMERLILEAARNRMSVEDVARNAAYSPRQIRAMMRDFGLDPKKGKSLLAKQSADALVENAALLGVDPREMDLTSPLAYLPMGSVLREFLETSRVTSDEIDAEIEAEIEPITVTCPACQKAQAAEDDALLEVAFLLWQVEQGYIKDEDRAGAENWFKIEEYRLHPDDVKGREPFIEAAREVLRVVKRIQSPAEDYSDFPRNKAALLASLTMGVQAEQDNPHLPDAHGLRPEQLQWVAAWLAGEGFGAKR